MAHRWGKPTKRERRIDPRYHLEETATRGEKIVTLLSEGWHQGQRGEDPKWGVVIRVDYNSDDVLAWEIMKNDEQIASGSDPDLNIDSLDAAWAKIDKMLGDDRRSQENLLAAFNEARESFQEEEA